jgi:DNA-binding GntR family transcriptional regulator
MDIDYGQLGILPRIGHSYYKKYRYKIEKITFIDVVILQWDMKDLETGMKDLEGGASPAITRTRAIYERLRRDIIQGTLLPGEKLRIEVLRARYNVGGTPLREAMNRLSTEGLVIQSDQRGFRVTPVSADALLELTRTRCWINEVALRESIARGGRDWEEGVLLALHRLSRVPIVVDGRMNPDFSELHRVFHAALLAGCGSRWLMDFNDLLFDCAERYRNLLAVMGAVRDVHSEHRAIAEAAIERKTALAIGLLNDHYEKTSGTLLRAIEAGGLAGG